MVAKIQCGRIHQVWNLTNGRTNIYVVAFILLKKYMQHSYVVLKIVAKNIHVVASLRFEIYEENILHMSNWNARTNFHVVAFSGLQITKICCMCRV